MLGSCANLERAKYIAKGRGLPVSEIRCTAPQACDGTDCVYQGLDEDELTRLGQENLEKFYARITTSLGMYLQQR